MSVFTIRAATAAEIPALDTLVQRSARLLSAGYYDDAQTEAAIAHVFGVDSQLVADGSYFLADVAGHLAGCGGWSRRRTLFGGDNFAGREEGFLDPAREAAKIRAFFVDPDFARRGIAAALLDASERAAAAAGFAMTELMATLPGVPFYAARGYVATGETLLDAGGVAITFVPMLKALKPPG